MESGKKAEAGPSTTTRGGFDEKLERKRETSEIPPAVAAAIDDGEEDDGDAVDNGVPVAGFVPGPLLSLKEQIEKDKEDDSLRRWKEKLLGCVESDLNGQLEPEVKFHSIGIISDDIGEINTPLPVDESQSGHPLFALREGSRYQLKLTFSVLHNIVSGLAYSNTVSDWGLADEGVDTSAKESNHVILTMLSIFKFVRITYPAIVHFVSQGTREPYVHTLEEDTTPSGVLARGTYSARLKFEDDDRRCHMELKYSFEIKKRR
ncbi:hypothetical protein NC651_007332 [Populus alba x Populus x berolinensis]|nr:hypothetical protein NC651_007332 [Populus alba x Populus x berolinensis]